MLLTQRCNGCVTSFLHAHKQPRHTSQGSLVYKDQVAQENDPLVDTLLQSGAIILGKTNTPEFGAGANTFNEYVLIVVLH